MNKCLLPVSLLQRTGKHSAPTWQLSELDPGFRGGSAWKTFSLLIKKKDDLTSHGIQILLSPQSGGLAQSVLVAGSSKSQ